jgi:pilus assembly protein CpaE
VATHLNLTPRFDLAGLATDEQALADPELARSYLTIHSSGLAVLAAPARPEADFRVSVEHVQRIIELLRPSFDHVVVDLGSRLDPRALWVLEQADAHAFVLFPEIAALRGMSLLMAFLADTTPLQARTLLVVNHVFPKELLKTRDVQNLLHAKPAAEVPYTEVEIIRSVNEGVPLVMARPASAAAAAMRRLAQAVIGIEAPTGGHREEGAAEPLQPALGWYRRRDSNPHALRPPGLSRLRLPFRHSGPCAIRRRQPSAPPGRRPVRRASPGEYPVAAGRAEGAACRGRGRRERAD